MNMTGLLIILGSISLITFLVIELKNDYVLYHKYSCTNDVGETLILELWIHSYKRGAYKFKFNTVCKDPANLAYAIKLRREAISDIEDMMFPLCTKSVS